MKTVFWTGIAAVALVVGLVIGRTAQQPSHGLQPSHDLLDLDREGQPASVAKEAVFLATSARDISLFWRQPHLLEIHYYRIADILQFTNLWGTNELRTKWFSLKEPYWIEIRLVPSSTGFSILTPDGSFQ